MGRPDEISRLINDLVCDQLPIMLWSTDKELTFTWMGGGETGAAVGTTVFEYFRTTDPAFPPVAASLRALKGETARYEHEWLGRRFAAVIAPLRSPDDSITGTIGLAFDITDQTQAEETLRSLEARHSRILDTTAEIVFTLETGGRITSANRAAERVLGYSQADFCEMWLEDLAAPDARDLTRQSLQTVLRSEDAVTFEFAAITRTGERMMLDVTCSKIPDRDGLPAAVQAIARDTSVRRRVDAQVRRAQALESTALLASGVAEDLHDLLRDILGSAYSLKARMREGGASREAVSNIIDKAERATSRAEHLIEMTQQSRQEPTLVDVHSVLRNVTLLLMRTIDPRIRISTAFDADRAAILGEENQLYQLFMNLAAIARDAMPDGGDLRISTSRRNRDVAVRIDAAAAGDPRFAREEEPPLSLAVARAIVRAHAGSLTCGDDPSGGQWLLVTLPLYASAAKREAHASPGADEITGRILVIDDDPAVRRVLSRMLDDLGLEVTASGCARDAIRMYTQSSDKIDAIVLDADMQDLPGPECITQLRAVNPDARIIICSAMAAGGEKGATVWWIEKPYSMAKLASVMRSVLGVKAARTA